MIIYAFKNKINGKIYVGQTIRDFNTRLSEHMRKHNTVLGKAIAKYGIDNFDYKIIDEAESIDELNEKETYWIKRLNSMNPNGYNLCYGGNVTIGYTHKMESRLLMSMVKKARGSHKGKKNHYYGVKHTPEIREKMRLAWTDERKQKQSERSKKMDRSYQFVKVRNIDTGEVFDSVKQAAEAYNLKDTHISRVCKGKRKRTGGYRWEYAN